MAIDTEELPTGAAIHLMYQEARARELEAVPKEKLQALKERRILAKEAVRQAEEICGCESCEYGESVFRDGNRCVRARVLKELLNGA